MADKDAGVATDPKEPEPKKEPVPDPLPPPAGDTGTSDEDKDDELPEPPVVPPGGGDGDEIMDPEAQREIAARAAAAEARRLEEEAAAHDAVAAAGGGGGETNDTVDDPDDATDPAHTDATGGGDGDAVDGGAGGDGDGDGDPGHTGADDDGATTPDVEVDHGVVRITIRGDHNKIVNVGSSGRHREHRVSPVAAAAPAAVLPTPITPAPVTPAPVPPTPRRWYERVSPWTILGLAFLLGLLWVGYGIANIPDAQERAKAAANPAGNQPYSTIIQQPYWAGCCYDPIGEQHAPCIAQDARFCPAIPLSRR